MTALAVFNSLSHCCLLNYQLLLQAEWLSETPLPLKPFLNVFYSTTPSAGSINSLSSFPSFLKFITCPLSSFHSSMSLLLFPKNTYIITLRLTMPPEPMRQLLRNYFSEIQVDNVRFVDTLSLSNAPKSISRDLVLSEEQEVAMKKEEEKKETECFLTDK
jgi:hypothetical protein